MPLCDQLVNGFNQKWLTSFGSASQWQIGHLITQTLFASNVKMLTMYECIK